MLSFLNAIDYPRILHVFLLGSDGRGTTETPPCPTERLFDLRLIKTQAAITTFSLLPPSALHFPSFLTFEASFRQFPFHPPLIAQTHPTKPNFRKLMSDTQGKVRSRSEPRERGREGDASSKAAKASSADPAPLLVRFDWRTGYYLQGCVSVLSHTHTRRGVRAREGQVATAGRRGMTGFELAAPALGMLSSHPSVFDATSPTPGVVEVL